MLTSVAFVFLVGLTAAGLCGSLMQIATGRTLGFIEPYVTPRWIARSLLATLAAGPMMLVNEALQAWRERRAGWRSLFVALVIACLWSCATGVLIVDVASRIGRPLVG